MFWSFNLVLISKPLPTVNSFYEACIITYPFHQSNNVLHGFIVRKAHPAGFPLSDHGYTCTLGAFHDALCLRYGWQPTSRLQVECVCEK